MVCRKTNENPNFLKTRYTKNKKIIGETSLIHQGINNVRTLLLSQSGLVNPGEPVIVLSVVVIILLMLVLHFTGVITLHQ